MVRPARAVMRAVRPAAMTAARPTALPVSALAVAAIAPAGAALMTAVVLRLRMLPPAAATARDCEIGRNDERSAKSGGGDKGVKVREHGAPRCSIRAIVAKLADAVLGFGDAPVDGIEAGIAERRHPALIVGELGDGRGVLRTLAIGAAAHHHGPARGIGHDDALARIDLDAQVIE
jgi:hypothetical protein